MAFSAPTGEFANHLFGGVVPSFHAFLHAPFWSVRTRITSGSVQGDLCTEIEDEVTMQVHSATRQLYSNLSCKLNSEQIIEMR